MTAGSDPVLDLAREQSPDWTPYLAVDADLDIEVDTAAGEHVTVDSPGTDTGCGWSSTVPSYSPRPPTVAPSPRWPPSWSGLSSAPSCTGPAAGSRSWIRPTRAGSLPCSPAAAHHRRPSGWALAARTMAPATIAVAVAAGVVAVAVTALLAAAAVIRRRSWLDTA